jgi:phospholipase/carboxylesterase
MDDIDRIARVLEPLLRALEALEFVARHMHPTRLPSILATIGAPDEKLRAARAGLPPSSDSYSALWATLDEAADHALAAFDALRDAGDDELRGAFRALRHAPQALEALYPLAGILPPVNRFFLDPSRRDDEALAQQFLAPPRSEMSGVLALSDGRGGCWMYAPEILGADTPAPLVVALHGGSGDGRRFLWSWLRDARTFGAVLAAPSSLGDTWALMDPGDDAARLAEIVAFAQATWRIDPARILLTGMSDGGTFSYAAGLRADAPFTHLAPVAAAFHPMLTGDPARAPDLPIHIAHGAYDWMFPLTMAQEARDTLTAMGAAVTYREIADLSHTYPRELNRELLDWMAATAS